MLNVDIEKSDNVVVVRCAGRLVRGPEVATLRSVVMSDEDARIVMLDLSDVEMVDAGGLTVLLSLHLWARNRSIQFKLVNPTPFVQHILEITRLDRVFEISDFEYAVAVLRGQGCWRQEQAAAQHSAA